MRKTILSKVLLFTLAFSMLPVNMVSAAPVTTKDAVMTSDAEMEETVVESKEVKSLLGAKEKDYNYAYFTYNYETYVLKKSEYAQFEHDLREFATIDEFYFPALIVNVTALKNENKPTDFSDFTEITVDPRQFWDDETWKEYNAFEEVFEVERTEDQWEQIKQGIYRHEIWLSWKGLYRISDKKMRDNSNVFLRSPDGKLYAVNADGSVNYEKEVPTFADNFITSTNPATAYSAGTTSTDTTSTESTSTTASTDETPVANTTPTSDIPEQLEITSDAKYSSDYFKLEIFMEVDKLAKNTAAYVIENTDKSKLKELLMPYRDNICKDLTSVDFENPNIYLEDKYVFDFKIADKDSSSRGTAIASKEAKDAITYLNENKVSIKESDGTMVRVTYAKNGKSRKTIYYLTDENALFQLLSYNVGVTKKASTGMNEDDYLEWINTPAQ